MVNKILHIIKNETVLSVAVMLAVMSAFFVKPDMEYLGYIDFRTLALLFCLMAVMAGVQKTGVFRMMAEKLFQRIHSIRELSFILIMLCFFFSMLVTNDVALITFVPFTFVILDMTGGGSRDKLLIKTVVMQTVAANLGSMLTPIGNPQNLYLHGISGMGVGEFIMLMLPYTAASFLILSAWTVLRNKNTEIKSTLKVLRIVVGVNLGGLGTLIASMASLISFKFVGRENKALRGKYLLYFTAINVVFLIILLGLYYVLG